MALAHEQEVGPGDVRFPDVLLGRGQAVHHHAGNVAFRKVVRARSFDYDKEGRTERDNITKEIITLVTKAGGRFLRPAREGVMIWVECPLQTIRTKVKQALRDDAKKQKSRGTGSRSASLTNTRSMRETVKRKSVETEVKESTTRPTTGGDHQVLTCQRDPINRSNTLETRLQSNDARMSRLVGSLPFSEPCNNPPTLFRVCGYPSLMGTQQPYPPPLLFDHQQHIAFNQPSSIQELLLATQTSNYNPFTAMTRTQLYRDYLIAEYLRDIDRSTSDDGRTGS